MLLATTALLITHMREYLPHARSCSMACGYSSPVVQSNATKPSLADFISVDVDAKGRPFSIARDFDFVERPSHDFFCPVSLELLLEPQLTLCCGNHLSLETTERLQKERKPCPICNSPRWDSVLDKYHRRKVREVRVYCWYRENGCGWVGEVSELKKHSDSCEGQLWECEYCALKLLYEEGRDRHWSICLHFPEPCLNGCEVGSVERCNMEQHRSVCSLEPVPCEMKEFGCNVVVPRKDLATHIRESELQHLTAMMMLNLRLTKQLQHDSAERDRKIENLQEKLTKTSETVRIMQTDQLKILEEQVTENMEIVKNVQRDIEHLKRQNSESIDKMEAELTHIQRRTAVTESSDSAMNIQKDLAQLKGQIQELQESDRHIKQHMVEAAGCLGSRVFVFKSYCKCKRNAKRAGGAFNSTSPQFYSHYEGYSVLLMVRYYNQENGDVGVFLCLSKGGYDHLLQWPVKMSVKLELLNQAGDHHHVVRSKILQWYSKNTGHNYEEKEIDISLMKYHDLEQRQDSDVQYMMSDSLKFRVHITVLKY